MLPDCLQEIPAMHIKYAAICLILLSTSACYADRNEDVESVRAMLLQNMSKPDAKEKLPADVMAEYVSIIKNDSTPIPPDQIDKVFATQDSGSNSVIRRQAYITAIMFRERDDQKTITAYFGKLNAHEQVMVVGSLTTIYNKFITSDYLPLVQTGLRNAICDYKSGSKKSPRPKDSSLTIAQDWISVAAKTENPKAGEVLREIIEKEVGCDNSLRFNLSSAAISRMGSDALPIARWYFPDYAWKPIEISAFAKYLRKYDDPASFGTMMNEKEVALREALEAMNPNYNPVSKKILEKRVEELNEGMKKYGTKPAAINNADEKPTKESSDKK